MEVKLQLYTPVKDEAYPEQILEACEKSKVGTDGLPYSRLHTIVTKDGTIFHIFPMERITDRLYNDRILPTSYCVAKKPPYMKFFQQVSPWYERYGNAVRKMEQLAKDL